MLNEGWIDYMIYFSICLPVSISSTAISLSAHYQEIIFSLQNISCWFREKMFLEIFYNKLGCIIFFFFFCLCTLGKMGIELRRHALSGSRYNWAGLYFSRECFDYTIWLPFNLNLLIHMLSKLIFPDGQLIWPHTHCLHCQRHILIIVYCFKLQIINDILKTLITLLLFSNQEPLFENASF